jgi:hypothetical protein
MINDTISDLNTSLYIWPQEKGQRVENSADGAEGQGETH